MQMWFVINNLSKPLKALYAKVINESWILVITLDKGPELLFI